jgi:hypothetical protein
VTSNTTLFMASKRKRSSKSHNPNLSPPAPLSDSAPIPNIGKAQASADPGTSSTPGSKPNDRERERRRDRQQQRRQKAKESKRIARELAANASRLAAEEAAWVVAQQAELNGAPLPVVSE